MPGKIRLVYFKKEQRLELHQEGVDSDGMAIGHIFNVVEIRDESITDPKLSKLIQMIKAFDSDGKTVAWFWKIDIESLEVVE